MNKCSICEKPIAEPATECSVRCILEANQRGQARIVQARSAFTQAFQKMLQPDTGRLPELPEVPMFYVKHRVLKNRSFMHRDLILAFNDKGVASVEDRGNNRRWAEEAVRASRGGMEILEESVEKPQEVPVAKGRIDVPPEVPEAEAVEVLRDVAEEVVTSATEEEDTSKSKKTTKRTVGKKSSKK